jgi:hypothetical protein
MTGGETPSVVSVVAAAAAVAAVEGAEVDSAVAVEGVVAAVEAEDVEAALADTVETFEPRRVAPLPNSRVIRLPSTSPSLIAELGDDICGLARARSKKKII